jgi:hypothetical protein
VSKGGEDDFVVFCGIGLQVALFNDSVLPFCVLEPRGSVFNGRDDVFAAVCGLGLGLALCND